MGAIAQIIMDKKIFVLAVEPEKRPYTKEISCGLSSLQKEVDGYIQTVFPYEEPVVIVCDDEAKLKGSPPNRALRDENGKIYDIIAGTFLIAGVEGEDLSSLSPELIEQFKEKFDTPEMFVCLNGKLVVLPMEERKSWVCTDPDCAQFRREAPEKGDNVFELAQVNQYGCDLFRVAHGFVYLNEDVDENERESLVSMYGWDEDDLYSDEFNGILAEAVFETSATEYDTSAEYSSFEAAARALGHLIDVDIGKYLQI